MSSGALKNIAVNDIVIVRKDGTFPVFWPLAKVTQIYPSKDGLVRVVCQDLKGYLKASCHKGGCSQSICLQWTDSLNYT